MRTRFEFWHILAPCANGCPKCYSLEDQTILFAHRNLMKVETFSSGLCMQPSFIAVRIYPCACVRIRHLFQMSASGSMTFDAQVWSHLNCLEKGGFPALLWDTLKDFGYPTYPEYSARELMSIGK
jgi:hypothetical protein